MCLLFHQQCVSPLMNKYVSPIPSTVCVSHVINSVCLNLHLHRRLDGGVLQGVAVCRSVLQCAAAHCSVVQWITAECSVCCVMKCAATAAEHLLSFLS